MHPTAIQPRRHHRPALILASLVARVMAAAVAAALAWPMAAAAGDPMHKCRIQGTVTFQHSPCPPEGRVDRPSVAQLNAERQKRLAEAALAAEAAPSAAVPGVTQGPALSVRTAPAGPSKATAEAGETRPASRCDGRTQCSQMRSCSEARYFLANCPGVQMDGDGDGVPCEQQWCR